MKRNAISLRWGIIQGEIRYRWPSLPLAALKNELRTSEALAALLSEQMEFSQKRAEMEAQAFWNDLEEKFRLAAAV